MTSSISLTLKRLKADSEFMSSPVTDGPMGMMQGFDPPIDHLQIVAWIFLPVRICIRPFFMYQTPWYINYRKPNSSQLIQRKKKSWWAWELQNVRLKLTLDVPWSRGKNRATRTKFSHHFFTLPSLLASLTVLFGSQWETCSSSSASSKAHVSWRNRTPFTK